MRWLIGSVCFVHALCFADSSWLEQVENRIDAAFIEELRKEMASQLPPLPQANLEGILEDPCTDCFSGDISESAPKLLVFLSFSVPNETWIQLGHEMDKHDAVCVLRGIPNHSFQAFAHKIAELKNKGFSADVQLNPNLFKEYNITAVPSFVLLHDSEGEYDKITGNVSLEYAQKRFADEKIQQPAGQSEGASHA